MNLATSPDAMNANRLLLKFARRYPILIAITAVLGFSGAVFNGISTALIIPVILGYLGHGAGATQMPPFLQNLIALTGTTGDQQYLVLMGLVLLAIVGKNLASYYSAITSARLSQSLTSRIRKDGLKLLLDVDLDFYAKHKGGDLISQLGGEVARTAESIKVAIQIFTTIITILVFTGLLLVISWQLTLISTGLLLLVSLANQFFVRQAKMSGQRLSAASSKYTIALLEILSGIRLIKATGQETPQYQQIADLIDERESADRDSQANYALVSPINEVAGTMTVLVIVVVGRILFAQQLQSLSTLLLMYLLTLFRMLPAVGQLNSLRSQFANTSPSVQLTNEFLRRDNKPIMPPGTQLYTPLRSGIRFEQIAFKYPDAENWVLRDVTLALPKGKTLALVGSSGAGKSTLVDLLPRFYDCLEGRITIDGQDLRSYDLTSLRKSMGIVSQDTFLFNTTVAENIAYGCNHATPEQIIEAARRANASEFIEKLPQGFDTPIGDRGVMLSGGQRQRLAIARALLRDPDILILDEATSALDTVSEKLVQQSIDELSRNRTVLIIAHRLSTIQKADNIAVFDKGRVVEQGTHAELLKQAGLYAKLHAMQFSKESAPSTEAVHHPAPVNCSV
jgi:ATP-binding cassette, subfamily B, bacterial MsbA